MMRELADAIEADQPVVLATVVQTRRSVPRHPGSKMLIFGDGRISGTIGGGEMEHRVRVEAAATLRDGKPRLLSYRLVDPANGDPGVCGGEADIYLEPYMPAPCLYVIGAGHVGRAVSELATWLGHQTLIWDDRTDAIDELPASLADSGSSKPIDTFLKDRPPKVDDAIIVVTRNVGLDLELLPHLLASQARYVGLMGSSRRWETTRTGLLEAGIDPAECERVHAPIGIEIEAETPEEIAVSILAEVIGDRRGA